ncbi:uncharacterized protein LOC8274549 [Ricinus communis]|uniref:DUF3511 domain-containing protein n=1 Tax=Ricinus communis TaxID=3988 RepID=B9RQS2_RICCO|nr:uncharacterized protein LOC8274549 [Ricinus communis]EEF46093.1 conserved hypothetical protein [Ricinus communis]|eukprot:XP_002516091.1 uncharacterized protein LOC8274549 [Ricinus communis]
MEDYNRSRSYSYSSYGGSNMQIESYHGPQIPPPPATTSYELRSYSASYAQSQMANNNFTTNTRDFKLKTGKNASGSSSSKSWSFTDPEFQRKKRVASYKMYSVEGKVKGSFRRSFRWLKDRYTQVVYGWW